MNSLRVWDGYPDEPEKSGWHWIDDADGLRPLFWYGKDWPEPKDRNTWRDGHASLDAPDLRPGHYHGPVAVSPFLAALCQVEEPK